MEILYVIIALSLLILAHELGHFAAAKLFGVRVEEFGFGFPPRLISGVRGETRYSFNALPFGGFVRIFGEDAPPPPDDPDAARALVGKPLGVRAVVLGGGILMNLVAGWLLLSAVFMIGSPSHLGISEVVPGSPAERAGLAAGDLIARAELQATGEILADPIPIDSFVALVERASAAGAPLTLTVLRDGDEFTATLTGRVAPPEGEGALGVALFDTGIPRTGFWESMGKGAAATVAIFKMIIGGFAELIAGLFTGSDALRMVTGPVGIVTIAAESVAFGVAPFLNLMAIISLHLAFLNFLPFPALDGGRLAFLAIEGLKGSPVSRKVEQATHAVGFALLLILMVLVTVRDIGRLIP